MFFSDLCLLCLRRSQLHDVFNKYKSYIDKIILKFTNKIILGYLLGILLVLWYV